MEPLDLIAEILRAGYDCDSAEKLGGLLVALGAGILHGAGAESMEGTTMLVDPSGRAVCVPFRLVIDDGRVDAHGAQPGTN